MTDDLKDTDDYLISRSLLILFPGLNISISGDSCPSVTSLEIPVLSLSTIFGYTFC